MDNSNEKLTKKEYLELIVEGSMEQFLILVALCSHFILGLNEKRFKRIEKFYKNLNESLENIRDQFRRCFQLREQGPTHWNIRRDK